MAMITKLKGLKRLLKGLKTVTFAKSLHLMLIIGHLGLRRASKGHLRVTIANLRVTLG